MSKEICTKKFKHWILYTGEHFQKNCGVSNKNRFYVSLARADCCLSNIKTSRVKDNLGCLNSISI